MIGVALGVAPSRARGSKQRRGADALAQPHVAPSRARGSKPQRPHARAGTPRSSRLHGRVDRNLPSDAGGTPAVVAPSRARGSKPLLHAHAALVGQVAPSRARGSKQARAVERGERLASRLHGRVDRNSLRYLSLKSCPGRAFTGAWIETAEREPRLSRIHRRAFTGAWIETTPQSAPIAWGSVAPSRARGSKQYILAGVTYEAESRLHGRVDRNGHGIQSRQRRAESRLHGRVDRNAGLAVAGLDAPPVAPSRARGSKRRRAVADQREAVSRLHGRVDRNLGQQAAAQQRLRRAFTGAWIETTIRPATTSISRTSRLHGRVDRNDIHWCSPPPM